jgi:hypothetical protein
MLLTVFALTCASSASAAQTRYSLVGHCYALTAASGQPIAGGEHLRMQATTLGSYLLYRPDRTFLAAGTDGKVAPAAKPSPAADWSVTDAPGGTFMLALASAPNRPLGQDGKLVAAGATGGGFTFVPATGCAVFPEADLGATGTPAKGPTSYGAVSGLLEGHMHWMTFEFLGGDFHCGSPWNAYGIEYALPDCSSIEGPQGEAAPVQNFLNYGNPAQPHDTFGYPKLTSFGAHNLTYEGTYWRWVQRAYMGGLRLMVMSVNENRVLCELQTKRRNSCDEMSTVRKGFQDMHVLQRYVDAQAGGPGKGFFQIVTTPEQARRVINQGKMAVVLEIEVSELFGCRGADPTSCTKAKIDSGLDEMYKLGVRSSLLLNKEDNPLTGVRFDSGPIGLLINNANRESYGSYWSAKTCTGPLHDNPIESGNSAASALVDAELKAVGIPGGTTPTYPPAPNCNTRGLTDLGKYLEDKMIAKHMIINPDHMSQAAVDDTLTLLEAHHYSGVISPHGWMDPGNWPRIWKLGGMAFPGHSASQDYIKDYQRYRPRSTPYLLGWGYGADLGGLSDQPSAPTQSIHYPFKSPDGKVTLTRERTGDRTFDYTKDGVATYGQYADWFEDLREHGSAQMTRDMNNGAEAYLEMWERATGIPTRDCAGFRSRVLAGGLPRVRLGAGWESLLKRAGQPQQRTRTWSYCVAGTPNRKAADVAELTPGGRVELVTSSAKARGAGGVAVGAPAARLRRVTRSAGGGFFVKTSGAARYVYAVRSGRVAMVGVASASLARHPAALRAAMRRASAAKATQVRPAYLPNPAAAAFAITGRSLASGTSDPRLNAAYQLLCTLHGG